MVGQLRVVTLNVAHGRGTAFHQALTGRRQIEANLDAVANLLLAAGADIVALQEVDAASTWSGGFDHLTHLARRTGLLHVARGIHGDLGWAGITYGTGLIARWPIVAQASARFAKNALDTKGYVLAHVDVPGLPIDVCSLHLDFKRTSERRAQLEDVSQHLERREDPGRPLVVAGDFNCAVDARCGTLAGFARRHGLLSSTEPRLTFPSRRPRRSLDHVFVSMHLEVKRQEVLPVAVSDHRPVLVELAAVAAA
jgi:endonuclease/exonuclease/phosphatase family metal-dependent hydrolase